MTFIIPKDSAERMKKYPEIKWESIIDINILIWFYKRFNYKKNLF